MPDTVLITGFEPFAGLAFNPTSELVRMLDGTLIGNVRICGHVLPVAFDGHAARLEALLHQTTPRLVLGFGLYAGEDMIRLERVGINIADFGVADNAGLRLQGAAIEVDGPPARLATFPYAEIRSALLRLGIPTRISNSAGTYLCNATLYSALRLCADQPNRPQCGFIHVPYATQQVAAMLSGEPSNELAIVSPESVLPSMSLDLMVEAARTAIRVSLDTVTTS